MHVDSIDKIVTVYFAALCRTSFVYRDVVHRPRPVHVSPLLLRGYTCPANCGGCCMKFSLDYLPSDAVPYTLTKRFVEFDGRKVAIMSDEQRDNDDRTCRNLIKRNGRCGIHGKHPFTCDFELIRILMFDDHAVLTQKLYGRGWNFMRVDDERGARCEMLPPDSFTISEVVRKLARLQQWARHFRVATCIPEIVAWVKRGSCDSALILEP